MLISLHGLWHVPEIDGGALQQLQTTFTPPWLTSQVMLTGQYSTGKSVLATSRNATTNQQPPCQAVRCRYARYALFKPPPSSC